MADDKHRHSYRSFRQRVDSLKIDPHSRLSVRAHDYVETSFFDSVLKHWMEVNISGNFLDLVDVVRPISRSLSQILLHKDVIFDSLEQHLLKNDPYSLQAVSELMTQFAHDLGPDFLPYYSRYLSSLLQVITSTTIDDSQNVKNTSNTLEWCFTSMAFVFKYLSKDLSQDVNITFDKFLPVFTTNKKDYLRRFCAESLSYLIRKLSETSTEKFMNQVINKMDFTEPSNELYQDSVISLITETMTNSGGSFHSKTSSLMRILWTICIHQEDGRLDATLTLSSVILRIMDHSAAQHSQKVYTMLFDVIIASLSQQQSAFTLSKILKITISCIFAKSGKLISDWKPMNKIVNLFIQQLQLHCQEVDSSEFLLFVTLFFRNAELSELVKIFPAIWRLVCIFDGLVMITFVDKCIEISETKSYALGLKKALHEALRNLETNVDYQRLSVFISTRGVKSVWFEEFQLAPSQISYLINEGMSDSGVLPSELVWRWKCLQLSSVISKLQLAIIFQKTDHALGSESLHVAQGLSLTLLRALDSDDLTSSLFEKICSYIRSNLRKSSSSFEFLLGLDAAIDKCGKRLISSKPELLRDMTSFLIENLESPCRESRVLSSNLLRLLFHEHHSVVSLLQQAISVDEVDLLVSNTSQMKMQIRNLFKLYADLSASLDECTAILASFVIGLLHNKFQPCWLAVNDGIKLIHKPGFFATLGDKIMKALKTSINEDIPGSSHASFPIEDSRVRSFESFYESLLGSFLLQYKSIVTFHQANLESMMQMQTNHMNLSGSSSINALGRLIACLKSNPQVANKVPGQIASMLLEAFRESLHLSSQDQDQTITSREKLDLLSTCGNLSQLQQLDCLDEIKRLYLDLLQSKKREIQTGALDGLLALKNPTFNKYKDNLKNLLDDQLFKDEFVKMFSRNSEERILEHEADEIVPLALRILLGKIRGLKKHSKSSAKASLSTVLPNLTSLQITNFILDLSSNIPWADYFERSSATPPEDLNMKRLQGFLNIIYEICESLGLAYAQPLTASILPVLFILISTQHVLKKDDESSPYQHIVKTTRSLAIRTFNLIFQYTGGSYDWLQILSPFYFEVLKPRLSHFHEENAQLSSSLLQILLKWVDRDSYLQFYSLENFAVTKAILALLDNVHSKDEVVIEILDFCITTMTKKESSEGTYVTFIATVVDGVLKSLPRLLQTLMNREVVWRCSTLLLLIVEKELIDDDETRQTFINASSVALAKPIIFVTADDKSNLLISISSMIAQFHRPFEDISEFFDVCSSALRLYNEGTLRECVLKAFESIAVRYPETKDLYHKLRSTNTFKNRNMTNLDIDCALEGFLKLTRESFLATDPLWWRPLINNAIHYMHYVEEPVIRSSALQAVCEFIIASKEMKNQESFEEVFNSIIDPAIRKGLRSDDEIRYVFIEMLQCLVLHCDALPRFQSMKVLVLDPENDFFSDLNHIQISQRQKAVRSIAHHRQALSPQCLKNYILPILEKYLVCKDEKLRNLSDDAQMSYAKLCSRLSFPAFKTIVKSWLLSIKESESHLLRDRVRVSMQLVAEYCNHMGEIDDTNELSGQRSEFLSTGIVLPIRAILSLRNDATIVQRVPLLEVAVKALLHSSDLQIREMLPGLLTSSCQILRSKSQELRDVARKYLSKVAFLVGHVYMRYLMRELKAALSRGSQIHVLSYTVHSILVSTAEKLHYGDLDDSASLIVDVIMEDIFGAAGQDKDADGYTSKMKEVKAKKSFDTAQIIATKLSLQNFHVLTEPIKLLLSENLPLKTQRNLGELLRRYSQGFEANTKSGTQEMLILCYDLHKQSDAVVQNKRPSNARKDESHFLVNLGSTSGRMEVDKSKLGVLFQRLSFEILRNILSQHPKLVTASNLDGFIPLLEKSLSSPDENLLQDCFKVLSFYTRLDFNLKRDEFLALTINRAFDLIQSAPSTNSETSQACLRYITGVLRHCESAVVPNTAIKFILQKISPDLEEPQRQSLAFNFLRAVISRRIEIPEVYDVMDKLLSIMILNHHKEIRDMSRTIYFRFLMHYDQSDQRLEKRLKFIISNLSYPTQTGRETVMELMHSIILRASDSIIDKICTSFFVALSNSLTSDVLTKCREMSSSLLNGLLKRASPDKLEVTERLCISWMEERNKTLLRRCGLLVYKVYNEAFGFRNNHLDDKAIKTISNIMECIDLRLDDKVDWEDVYVSIEILGRIYKGADLSNLPFTRWIIDCLLYPHSWIRNLSLKLLITLLQDDSLSLESSELQLACSKVLRQLSAPGISESLGQNIVKCIAIIAKSWSMGRTLFTPNNEQAEEHSHSYHYAFDMIISKTCGIAKTSILRDDKKITLVSSIKILAVITSELPLDLLLERSTPVIQTLIVARDTEFDEGFEEELKSLIEQCLELMKKRLGASEYLQIFNTASNEVQERRRARKAKRAQLVTTAPEVASKLKLKKHERAREKRKNQKDENGLYKPKKRRIH